jgi:hypothetical protein
LPSAAGAELFVSRSSCRLDYARGSASINKKAEGGVMNLVFCDVFVMRAAKIRKLTSYLMEIN